VTKGSSAESEREVSIVLIGQRALHRRSTIRQEAFLARPATSFITLQLAGRIS
jgi:hypothetical protein